VAGVRMHAGAGNDLIILNSPIANFNYTIAADSGDDTITIANPDDSRAGVTVRGGEGNDRITLAGVGSTFLAEGEGGNDILVLESGRGSLWGGMGDDLIQSASPATLQGENGNDTITGSTRDDSIGGGNGDDLIDARAGNDTITGGNGADTIDASDGDDFVLAGAGDDSVLGGNGNDYVYGDLGNDTILGQAGDDTLAGDTAVTRTNLSEAHAAGDDLIMGGRGRDYLLGSTDLDAGHDTLLGQEQGDILNGASTDSMPDANADDIIPRALLQGSSPFAVDSTSAITLRFPTLIPARFPYDHTLTAQTVPAGAGDFAGSPFFAESDGVLRMRSQLPRDFTIGAFFDNWGIYVDSTHFGGYIAPPSNHPQPMVYINNQPFSRDRIVQPNDALTIDVRI
jgi:Ca2+-binding RTX toxin-like protein